MVPGTSNGTAAARYREHFAYRPAQLAAAWSSSRDF